MVKLSKPSSGSSRENLALVIGGEDTSHQLCKSRLILLCFSDQSTNQGHCSHVTGDSVGRRNSKARPFVTRSPAHRIQSHKRWGGLHTLRFSLTHAVDSEQFEQYHVVITTYGTVQSEFNADPAKKRVMKALFGVTWWRIVLGIPSLSICVKKLLSGPFVR